MSQNTSHAVMAQRDRAADSLDDFPTPPWATRALMEHVVQPTAPCSYQEQTAWEPACNRGYMARPLQEYFGIVRCSDIKDYSAECSWAGQDSVHDFLIPGTESRCIAVNGVDWIITNPPFALAEQFVRRALDVARCGVAVLVRTAFVESIGRYERLFSTTPPTVVAQFADRVPMVRGRCDPDASTATAYCWLVWIAGDPGTTRFVWIPPCRRRLERAEDYADRVPA